LVIEGSKIKAIQDASRPIEGNVEVIDCGGRTLMPGLIDAHWHATMAGLPLVTLQSADVGLINLAAADEAEKRLMRGFTSVRDMAGPASSRTPKLAEARLSTDLTELPVSGSVLRWNTNGTRPKRRQISRSIALASRPQRGLSMILARSKFSTKGSTMVKREFRACARITEKSCSS